MTSDANSKAYWDLRFSSGDWEKRGRWQTTQFALGQVRHFAIGRNFAGTLLDFGCALGDALPVYRAHFPKAKLMGVDFSSRAIEACRLRYGSIGTFLEGGCETVPDVDVIVASNVLEHLPADREVARSLLLKCRELYVVVPYQERSLLAEHVNVYDELYFQGVGEYSWTVFPCRGWSAFGWDRWYRVYLKNVIRAALGRELRRRGLQIMFHFRTFR